MEERVNGTAFGRRVGAWAASAALVGMIAACGGGAVDSAPSDEVQGGAENGSAGALVVIGGALAADNAAIYRRVLDGRDGDGPVCVIPTASGSPDESMASAVGRIDEHGGPGVATGVLLTVDAPERADDAAVVAQLRECSGFFFTGGSQTRIVDTFRPEGRSTAARDAVMERWNEGAVVAGTSAGAAMMGGRMIAGGVSLDAFEYGVGEAAGDDAITIREGMGFFEAGWLDQHFLARGRWGRLLMSALSEPPYATGFGIDENTALVVEGGQGEVVGASGVVVIDARDGITLELLGAGDRVDLQTLAVAPAAGRSELDTVESGPDDGVDPFARWQLLRDLAASPGAVLRYTVGDEAGTRLTLEPGPDYRALATAMDGGPEGTPLGLSVGPYRVTVER